MSLSIQEKASLHNMLEVCRGKYDGISIDSLTYGKSCDSCTGSCKGHGMSVWSTCDVK